MAVGLNHPVDILPVRGVELAAACAGMYKKTRLDSVLVSITPGATSCGVFTRNNFCAAPILVARNHLAETLPRYFFINAGNANAGTGERGYRDAMSVCETLAGLTGISSTEVLPFSTGVIGEFLPVDKLCNVMPELLSGLKDSNWVACATAIMTTDTVPKAVSRTLEIAGNTVTVTGIAKGAGMIRPDMATMLAFLATDAAVELDVLTQVLDYAMARSFNRICVDGDTSTNDACLLTATGVVNMTPLADYGGEDTIKLRDAVTEVCALLAQSIVRDGEGATKFVTIHVQDGRDADECLAVGYAIATSPLVKTALFASDPNWGRILAAVGRAGLVDLDIAGVGITVNGVCIVENGVRSESYTEGRGRAEFEKDEILLQVNLGRGTMEAVLWTCDLSYDYVKINAEYRT